MKQRIAAGVFCLLLIVQLASPPARAAGYICFVAMGESILPMSDETMPFWRDGYLYIASSAFTGAARESLNIGRMSSSGQVILYSIGHRGTLRFEAGKDYAYDADGGSYYPGGIQRNGQMYVPVAVVAQFFGLQYSVANVNLSADGQTIRGDLAWLRQPESALTEQVFVNAASFAIASRYTDYLQQKEAQSGASTPEPPTGVEVEGKRIFLCLTAGEDAAALLDVLDSWQAQAAFFCTPEFLEHEGDLLRRMTATGQAIAILADATDPHRSVVEQLEAGNRALALATCGKTRLALVENGTEEDLRAAREAGYRCLAPDLDRADYALRTISTASSLLQQVSSYRGNVTVWLGETVNAAGLRAFLSAAEQTDSQCLAWTETA